MMPGTAEAMTARMERTPVGALASLSLATLLPSLGISIANVGLPNAMTQMVNTFKDRIPMLVAVAAFSQEALGREGPQDYDYQEYMLGPITKWRWTAQTTHGVAEATRRALKFAAPPPSGPVFLAIPENVLRSSASGMVMDRSLFDVSMHIRPDAEAIGGLIVATMARCATRANNPSEVWAAYANDNANLPCNQLL